MAVNRLFFFGIHLSMALTFLGCRARKNNDGQVKISDSNPTAFNSDVDQRLIVILLQE